MTDRKVEELLWQEIDGELGPEERARLEFFLETEPVLQEERSRLEALSEALSRLEEVEAPAELGHRIRRGLAAAERPRRVVSFWRPQVERRQAFALAAVLAAVAIGIAIYLGRGAPVRDASLVGTALPGSPPRPPASPPGLQVDGLELEIPDADAVLRLRRDGALVRATLVARGATEIEVVFEQAGGEVGLAAPPALSAEPAPGLTGEAAGVRSEAGRVVVRSSTAGELELAIAPDPSAVSPLTVRVTSGGREVLETEMEIGSFRPQVKSTTNFPRIRR